MVVELLALTQYQRAAPTEFVSSVEQCEGRDRAKAARHYFTIESKEAIKFHSAHPFGQKEATTTKPQSTTYNDNTTTNVVQPAKPIATLGEAFKGLEQKIAAVIVPQVDEDHEDITELFSAYEQGYQRVGPFASSSRQRNTTRYDDAEDEKNTDGYKPVGVHILAMSTIERLERQMRNGTEFNSQIRRERDEKL